MIMGMRNVGYVFLGDIYQPLDEKKAQEYYQKAVSLDPDAAGACFGLGLIYNKQGKLDEALEQFQKAVDLSPYNEPYLDNLGYAYSRKNLYTQAVEVYKRILQIDADYLSVYYEIARLRLLRGDLDEALQYQQALVDRLEDRKTTDMEKNKVPLYFQVDNNPPIELYELPEKTAYAWYGLSLLLYLSDQPAEARQYIDKIRQLQMSQNAGTWVDQLVAADLQRLKQEQPRWAGGIDAWRRQLLAAGAASRAFPQAKRTSTNPKAKSIHYSYHRATSGSSAENSSPESSGRRAVHRR